MGQHHHLGGEQLLGDQPGGGIGGQAGEQGRGEGLLVAAQQLAGQGLGFWAQPGGRAQPVSCHRR